MVSLYVFCLVVFIEVVAGVSVNETQTSGNKTDVKTRSGRWLGDNEPQYSVQLGYYASPDYTDESDDRDDKGKYSLPTSFADFKPDDKQSRYPPPPPLPNAWKTDSLPAPWMFPSDMTTLVNAMADVHDEKPTGLLAKLKAEPLTILLAAAIPLSILLAAVLPSLINLIMNGNMNTPPATTIASGNRSDTGRNYKNNEPSIVVKVLEAVENMSAFNDLDDICFQKVICQVAKGINGTKYRSIQQNALEMLPFVPDAWLDNLGLKDMKEILKSGNCASVQCSNKTRNKDSSEKKTRHSNTLNKKKNLDHY